MDKKDASILGHDVSTRNGTVLKKHARSRLFIIIITAVMIIASVAVIVGNTRRSKQAAFDSLDNITRTVINRIDDYSGKVSEEIEETGSVLLRKAYAFRQMLDINGGEISAEQLRQFVDEQHLHDALLFDESGKAFVSVFPEGIGFDLNAYDATRYYLDIFKDNSIEIIEIAAIDADGDGDGGNYNYCAIASKDGKYIIEITDDANDVENALAKVSVDEVARGLMCDYSARTMVIRGGKIISSNDETLIGTESGIPGLAGGPAEGSCVFDGERCLYSQDEYGDYSVLTLAKYSEVLSRSGGRTLVIVLSVILLYLAVLAGYILIRRQFAENERHNDEQAEKEAELQEQMARVMGLSDNFQAIYDVDFKTGSYDLYTYDNSFADSVLIKMARGDSFYSDAVKDADLVVFPDDRELTRTSFSDREYIAKKLDEEGGFTVDYRIVATGEPVWYKAKVVRKAGDDTRFLTGVFNINDSKIQEEARQKEEKIQNDIIMGLSSAYNTLYYVDLNTGKYSARAVNAKDDFSKDYYYRFPDYETMAGTFADEMVHPDDREMFRCYDKLENMRKQLEHDKMHSIRFRRKAGDDYIWMEQIVVKTENTDEEAHYIVTAFADRDSLVKAEMEQQEALKQRLETKTIIDSLAESYISLYQVNVNTGRYKILKKADTVPEGYMTEDISFDEAIKKWINDEIYPEDREKALEAVSIGNIRKQFETAKSYAVNIRHNRYGNRYREMRFTCSGDFSQTGNCFVSFIDNHEYILSQKKAEEQGKQMETMSILSTMAEDFDYIAAVSQKEKTVTKFWSSDKYDAVEKLTDRNLPSNKRFDSFLNLIIHPDDMQMFREKSDYDAAMEVLNRQYNYKFEFRTLFNGTEEYYRIKFALKPDNHDIVILGLLNIDKQVRSEMETAVLKERTEMDAILLEQASLTKVLLSDYERAVYVHLGATREEDVTTVLLEDEYQLSVIPEFSENHPFARQINLYIDTFVHPDDRNMVSEKVRREVILEKIREDLFYTVDFRTMENGEMHYAQLRFSKVGDETGEYGFVAGLHKTDMERKAEIALEEALSMAQSANRAKTTFLNNMSHDIRTPMNAIIGYTGLAASHIDSKDLLQDYLKKIGQSSDHLLSLINDVLDMSRIESGKMNLDEKPENLSEIMHTLRNIIQSDIKAKELDFFMDSADVTDENIICDKLRLNQVLLNVLSNSVKYTQPGGTISLRIIQKSVSENGYGEYEFHLKDNGMGMSEEFLKTIFDPFTRVQSSTVSGIQGTGLGMAITKNIVDMMGGNIDIKSAEGEGTEVTIDFKFKLGEAQEKFEKIAELEGLRSLVVDDDMNACKSISKMLRDCGMRSEWCESGRVAVVKAEEAHSMGDSFRVYIIDWLMPDMNGIETTRRIRRIVGEEVPIVILTAYDWSDIEEEAREAGVTAFISKPLFPSDLHSVLEKCIGKEIPVKTKVSEYDFKGKRILLVEDNEMNREIATEILEEAGFTVDIAEDGDIAVEKVRHSVVNGDGEGIDYDAILMDIQMPRMDGYEATRIIRGMSLRGSHVPIIATTANAFEEDRKAAIEAGMDEHIAKPIDIQKLKETLAKYL